MVRRINAVRTSKEDVRNQEKEEEEIKREEMKRGKIIKQAVLMAEDLFPEPKSGKQKRKWVVEFINEHINVPFLNERQEAKAIGFAVDVVCDLLQDALKGKS